MSAPRPAPRSQVRLWDGRWWPCAGRYAGAPVFRYGWAPSGLLTRRQLRAVGLRPAGQDPAAFLVWGPANRARWAYLFRGDLAAPVREMSAAQRAALARCNAAQQLCPTCMTDVGYRIPRSLGECWPCADARDNAGHEQANGTGRDFTAEWAAHRSTDQHAHQPGGFLRQDVPTGLALSHHSTHATSTPSASSTQQGGGDAAIVGAVARLLAVTDTVRSIGGRR